MILLGACTPGDEPVSAGQALPPGSAGSFLAGRHSAAEQVTRYRAVPE